MKIEKTKLIGIAFPEKTINKNGQSAIDCGKLWQQFEKEQIFDKIPGKITQEVLAVYHDYEGDFNDPYAYFIGCKVDANTSTPEHFSELFLAEGEYTILTAKGKMPDCVAQSWREIWKSDMPRAYKTDFEVYDERSHDWNNAEVSIYVSVS